ncbi:MAG: amidohydrolase family protein [Bryobacteraceae bacterium]
MIAAKAPQPTTKVNFDVPRHACDCHTHMFGDPKQFPFSPTRSYTPELALPAEMLAVHRALHIERVVVVTPSVYGTDNSATLHAIKALGRTARGVAVIDDRITDRDLDALARAGIRGVRINVATAGPTDPAAVRRRFEATAGRLKGRNWHIQIYTNAAAIPAIKDAVLDSPLPVVFDHFGGAQAALGITQPGFTELIELVRSGKAYVKISGAYRASTRAPGYPDVAPLAKALIAANQDRILWGTDWPHPDSSRRPAGEIAPFLPIDDGYLLNELPLWAPDAALRETILVRNPARLYEF